MALISVSAFGAPSDPPSATRPRIGVLGFDGRRGPAVRKALTRALQRKRYRVITWTEVKRTTGWNTQAARKPKLRHQAAKKLEVDVWLWGKASKAKRQSVVDLQLEWPATGHRHQVRTSAKKRSRLYQKVLSRVEAALNAPPTEPPPEPQDNREIAKVLAEQSRQAYQAGALEDAAALLRQAYARDPDPVLQYNLARVLDSAGDLQGAATAYRHYLDAAPNDPSRPLIERRLEAIDGLLAEPAPAPPPPPPLPPVAAAPPQVTTDRPASPLERHWPAWSVMGAGGLALIAGTGLAFATESKETEANREDVHQTAAELARDAESLATARNVTLIGGSLLLAGGATWWLIDAWGPAAPAPAITWGVSPHQVVVGGRF